MLLFHGPPDLGNGEPSVLVKVDDAAKASVGPEQEHTGSMIHGVVTVYVLDALCLRAEVAKNAASVVLARPDPRLVSEFIRIARRTRAGIRENLTLAFLFNGIAVPLAMAGKLSPALAGAAMALSSVSVVTNALRLKRFHLKNKK